MDKKSYPVPDDITLIENKTTIQAGPEGGRVVLYGSETYGDVNIEFTGGSTITVKQKE